MIVRPPRVVYIGQLAIGPGIRGMSDEAEAANEPAWKTDPLLAHIPLTEEGVARWRVRWQELQRKKRKEDWDEIWQQLGLGPR
jgi:hypothetical protein